MACLKSRKGEEESPNFGSLLLVEKLQHMESPLFRLFICKENKKIFLSTVHKPLLPLKRWKEKEKEKEKPDNYEGPGLITQSETEVRISPN